MVASSHTSDALQQLSAGLADAVEQVGKSVVAVSARRGVPASGAVWQPGVIVTADHVLQREENITVTLPDGTATNATLAGRDGGTDLAVLKIGNDLPAAQIGDANALKVGSIVLAVARPGDAGLSASWGAVSSVGGPWRTWAGGQIDRFIRPDLTLYPGFSGGPLVDAAGQVVGINTSGLHRVMTLTIPASTVNRIVEQLLARGHVARGYLGIGMQVVRLPEQQAQALGLSQPSGLIIISVEPNGPAAKAGILVGDILVALNGQPVSDTDQIQAALGPESVGRTVQAKVVRGGTAVTVPITVGERPQRGK